MNPFDYPQYPVNPRDLAPAKPLPVCPSDLYNVAPKPEPWSREHQNANAESMLQAYRRTQRRRARSIALAISIVLFFVALGVAHLWRLLSTHFLP